MQCAVSLWPAELSKAVSAGPGRSDSEITLHGLYVLQTVKPLQKYKRKTVYFVKTCAAKLDSDNIKKTVRCRNSACLVGLQCSVNAVADVISTLCR